MNLSFILIQTSFQAATSVCRIAALSWSCKRGHIGKWLHNNEGRQVFNLGNFISSMFYEYVHIYVFWYHTSLMESRNIYNISNNLQSGMLYN